MITTMMPTIVTVSLSFDLRFPSGARDPRFRNSSTRNLSMPGKPPSPWLRNARRRAAPEGFGPIGLGRCEPLEVIDPNPDRRRDPGDPRYQRRTMSTIVILIIVIAAIVIVGALIAAASRRKRERELGAAQVDAKRDDVSHHRDQAEDARAESELAKERADRAAAEAELNEHKAAERERELESRD